MRAEALDVIASLPEEQLRLVLAYALCLLEASRPERAHPLEGLLEEPALAST